MVGLDCELSALSTTFAGNVLRGPLPILRKGLAAGTSPGIAAVRVVADQLALVLWSTVRAAGLLFYINRIAHGGSGNSVWISGRLGGRAGLHFARDEKRASFWNAPRFGAPGHWIFLVQSQFWSLRRGLRRWVKRNQL
jgi:hypothetical protein